MREIRFRGFVNDPDVEHYGEWIYGDLIHIGGEVFIQHDKEAPDVIALRVDPETVGQYIGIRDKKGKEIYELDIVSVRDAMRSTRSATVEYFNKSHLNEGAFVGMFGYTKPTDIGKRIELFSIFDDITIIGNRYDNPELLND